MKPLALGFGSLLLGLLFVSYEVHAEGGSCPPGYYPIGGQGTMGCAPMPGNNNSPQQQLQTPQRPAEIWQDRYGAIAIDDPRGVLGAATGMSTPRSARQAALIDCQNKGGGDCWVSTPFRNGCAAVIASMAPSYVVADDTAEKASARGMSTCQRSGNQNCRVYYTACSPPVRVQ